jgi:hypothetical protein
MASSGGEKGFSPPSFDWYGGQFRSPGVVPVWSRERATNRCGSGGRGVGSRAPSTRLGEGISNPLANYRKWRHERRRKRDQTQAEARKSLHDEPSGATYQSAQNKADKWTAGM